MLADDGVGGASSTKGAEPAVRVDFHGRQRANLWGGGTFQADRHSRRVLGAPGPTRNDLRSIIRRDRLPVADLKIETSNGSERRRPSAGTGPTEQAAVASSGCSGGLATAEASTEDETFTPEMIAKRREILEEQGQERRTGTGPLPLPDGRRAARTQTARLNPPSPGRPRTTEQANVGNPGASWRKLDGRERSTRQEVGAGPT